MTDDLAASVLARPDVWAGRSNAARKAIRTTLQVVVALAGPVALLATGVLEPSQALALSSFLTPVVAFAQNLLEDKGIIGTWLRRPSPADAASLVVTLPATVDASTPVPPLFDQDKPRYRLVRRPPAEG